MDYQRLYPTLNLFLNCCRCLAANQRSPDLSALRLFLPWSDCIVPGFRLHRSVSTNRTPGLCRLVTQHLRLHFSPDTLKNSGRQTGRLYIHVAFSLCLPSLLFRLPRAFPLIPIGGRLIPIEHFLPNTLWRETHMQSTTICTRIH
jgi:hypothetical protein